MASNACWGIEIGSGAIKALKIEAGDNGVNVVDAAVIPHPKVLSTPGIDQNDVLRVSLGALTSQIDLSKASIAVSVPGHAAFARFAKLPPVEAKKVPAIVKFEAVQQIPFPLDQVEWDFQTFMSPDSPEIEVGIFAITRERIMERLNMLAEVGITPNYVTLSPVAAYNALAYDLQFSEQTPGTIILDVGTTSTDLVVAEAGRVWVRTFPIGGHQFTEALVNQFKTSYAKAEKLKRESDEGAAARQVFQAMRPVFTDLAQDVQRSIGYYQSLHKDANLTRLIGIGSTFALPGLRKYLKQQLSMDVYRLEEFKRMNFDGVPDEARRAELKTAALQLTPAYGLALQGLGLNAISANLMPVAVVRERMWKDKVKWFAAAAGIAVVAGGAMFLRPWMDSNAIASTSKPAEIDEAVRAAAEQKRAAEEAQVIGAAQTDFRAVNMLSLLEARGIHAHLVDDLGQMLKSAEERAATWPAEAGGGAKGPTTTPLGFTLKKFETDYRTGGAEEPGVEAGRGGSAGGRGSASSAEAPAASSGPVTAENLDPALAGQPQVVCKLVVTTSQPNAFNFMLKTMDNWLRTHSKREGVPYLILTSSDAQFKITDEQEVAAAPPPGTTPSGEAGEGGGPGGRGQVAQKHTEIILGRPDSGGGGGAPDTGPTAASNPEVDRMAPLGTLKPTEEAGKRTTFELKWRVVILPPPGKKPAGGGS